MKPLLVCSVGLICTVVLVASPVMAEVPHLFNYQGYLADSEGVPLDTTASMTFTIYDDSVKTTVLWAETHPSVTVVDGIVNVLLGTFSELDAEVLDGSIRWMTIQMGSMSESDPPLPIVSVAYSYRAEYADTAGYALASPGGSGHWILNDGVLYTITWAGLSRVGNALLGDSVTTMVNWGRSCTTGVAGLDVADATVSGGTGNVAAGNSATVSGGTTNRATANEATIGGGTQNTAAGERATIGGGHGNTVDNYRATVSGGYGNTASGAYASIGGGVHNIAGGYASTVGGGSDDTASGHSATVSGGFSNTASGENSTIGGGHSNEASENGATIGGGGINSAAGENSTVAGGSSNIASANSSTVGGGGLNSATGVQATIGGGVGNVASGERSFIGGGANNVADGYRTTVSGGYYNAVSNWYGTVGGGYMNVVNGDYSAVLGGYADTIYSAADFSYLFGIGSRLTEDSTFMIDMPHIRFGSQADGYEFPPADGSSGQVLATDGNGQVSWTDGIGLTLPFIDSIESSSHALTVINTVTADSMAAIYGKKTGYLSKGYGVRGHCLAGLGSYGVAGTHGQYGTFGGLGGRDYGVYGISNSIYSGGYGGVFVGMNGVHGIATGAYGYAVYAEAMHTDGIGLFAKGGLNGLAADFVGNVQIRSYGTAQVVVELGEGLDYAEGFDVTGTDEVQPGAVLVIDQQHPGHLTLCGRSYDRRVAGIVAGAKNLGSGVRLGSDNFDFDVALAGRVYCNVDARDEAVEPGDLLTTSDVPGYAMKVRDYGRAQGAILGKAMEPMAKGKTGQILVLVTLQ